MLRSVKSQIILATSAIIIAILGATAYLVIDQKTKEINQDIFQKAVSFAELTHERVVTNYETNYQQQAFAHFEREMADIYSLNQDIKGLSIHSYNGNNLYKEAELDSKESVDLDRIQAIFPSVKTKKTNRIVYLEKTESGFRYTNLNGQTVEGILNTEQIENVVYPFRDQNNVSRSFSINYQVSYDALFARVEKTAKQIIVIALGGVLIALIIGFTLASGITRPIHSLIIGAEAIGRGDLKTRIPIKSKNEVGMLAKTFNSMAADLEKSTESMIEHEKVAKELELAGQIQQELLPTTLPTVENLDIAASLSAATEVGGDCYDFIPMEEAGKLLFYIADVTGHGVGAGLVSAINNALVPAFMDHYDNTDDMVVNLNKVLKLKTSPNVFVTLCMAIWNSNNNELEFTQAGHDPILHYVAANQKAVELAHGGMALGMMPDISKVIKTEKIIASQGDVFVLYTDGIPEAWKSDEENYGMDRLKESVERNCQLPTAQAIHDGIIKDVREFMGDFPQADDITLLVIKRTK